MTVDNPQKPTSFTATSADWRGEENGEARAARQERDLGTLERLQAASASSNSRILIKGGTIVTMDPTVGDFLQGDLLIGNGKIAQIERDLSAAAAGVDAVVDATGMIVMPGFHDTHRHCWQGQLRRLIPDVSVLGKYHATTHALLALHYRPEDIYMGNVISGLGAIDAGITTMLDFCHNPRSLAHAEAAIAAHRDVGLRVIWTCCGALHGDLTFDWPNALADLQKRYFSTTDQLLTMRLGLLGVPVGDHDIMLRPDRIAFARELGIEISADGIIGEPAVQAIEACARAGALGPDLTLIHCNGLTEQSWKHIADSGTHVSLAITSDAQIGIGAVIPPIQTALDHGVQPALSIDVEITLSYDMFTQMRMALNIQHMLGLNRRFNGDENFPPAISTRDVLRYATVEGARANGLAAKSGSLARGKEADIVLLDASCLNAMPLNNAVGTIVSGADSRNVDTVFVGGKVKKWRGRVLGYDQERLNRALIASRDHLFEKAHYPFDVFSAGIDYNPTAQEFKQGF